MRERATAQMRGVAILGGSALAFRVFALEAIDQPGVRPALWASVVLGTLMASPAALPLLLRKDEAASPLRSGSWGGRTACALLVVLAIYDAAASAKLFSMLAAYVALPDHSVIALSLPLIAAAALVCLMGAGAMSAAAVIWRRVALVFGIIALLVQVRDLRPGWLLPLLGTGFESVLLGAERAAGQIALAVLGVTLLGEGGRRESMRALRSLGWAALLCVGAVALFCMMVPVLTGAPSGRLFRLEMLADCGRNGFAAELVYVLMMTGGMMLVGFELLTASAALCAIRTGASFTACALLCASATALLCANDLSGESQALAVGPWYYPASLLAALLAVCPMRSKAAAS